MKKLILFFCIFVASTSLLRADAVTFEATVNSPRISLDEVLQLTLTFTGVNQDLDPINLPVLDGFSAKYMGPSTSISVINGDYHSERSFIYNLFPNKTGKFQIPAISASVGGQTYTTKPIDVEVFQNTAQAQAAAPVSDQNQGPSLESLKDRVKILVSVGKTNVYLNERVPLTIILLVNDLPLRDIQYPQFDKTGLSVDDFEKPEQGSQVIDGIRYDMVEFKTNIYPNRLGDLTLGPVEIQGNILYKTGQANPFSQDNNSFFGGDVFNNLFDSYANRPVSLTSDPVQLHVSALPSDGRPNDFSGAIGQSFNFQASVSPLQVKAGDPLTLKMSVQGSGNFKDMQLPDFHATGFKSYAPQIKNTVDQKSAEEVIIPTSTAIKEVPALHFSYFDTSANVYKTITQGPFAIQVTEPSPDQEFKAEGFSNLNQTPVTVPNQFSFAKICGEIYQFLKRLCQSMWFWVSVGFFLVVGVAYFLWQRFQTRLENDPAFARRLKAVREARQALMPAKGYIAKGQIKDFYALLAKVLRDYFANKWHQSPAALSLNEISNRLKTAQLDEGHIAQVKTILEQCDLVCFAGASRDVSQMNSDLSLVESLIHYLQQHLK